MNTNNDISFNLTFDDIFNDTPTQAIVLKEKNTSKKRNNTSTSGIQVIPAQQLKQEQPVLMKTRILNPEAIKLQIDYDTKYNLSNIKDVYNYKIYSKVEQYYKDAQAEYEKINIKLNKINLEYRKTPTRGNILQKYQETCATIAIDATKHAKPHVLNAQMQLRESNNLVNTMQDDTQQDVDLKIVEKYFAEQTKKIYSDVQQVASNIYATALNILQKLPNSIKDAFGKQLISPTIYLLN